MIVLLKPVLEKLLHQSYTNVNHSVCCTALVWAARLLWVVLPTTPHHSETLSHVFLGQDSMWCVSTWVVCLESDCLVLVSAEGPTGGLVLSDLKQEMMETNKD